MTERAIVADHLFSLSFQVDSFRRCCHRCSILRGPTQPSSASSSVPTLLCWFHPFASQITPPMAGHVDHPCACAAFWAAQLEGDPWQNRAPGDPWLVFTKQTGLRGPERARTTTARHHVGTPGGTPCRTLTDPGATGVPLDSSREVALDNASRTTRRQPPGMMRSMYGTRPSHGSTHATSTRAAAYDSWAA